MVVLVKYSYHCRILLACVEKSNGCKIYCTADKGFLVMIQTSKLNWIPKFFFCLFRYLYGKNKKDHHLYTSHYPSLFASFIFKWSMISCPFIFAHYCAMTLLMSLYISCVYCLYLWIMVCVFIGLTLNTMWWQLFKVYLKMWNHLSHSHLKNLMLPNIGQKDRNSSSHTYQSRIISEIEKGACSQTA